MSHISESYILNKSGMNASNPHHHQAISSFIFGSINLLSILSKILMIKLYKPLSFAVQFPDGPPLSSYVRQERNCTGTRSVSGGSHETNYFLLSGRAVFGGRCRRRESPCPLCAVYHYWCRIHVRVLTSKLVFDTFYLHRGFCKPSGYSNV